MSRVFLVLRRKNTSLRRSCASFHLLMEVTGPASRPWLEQTLILSSAAQLSHGGLRLGGFSSCLWTHPWAAQLLCKGLASLREPLWVKSQFSICEVVTSDSTAWQTAQWMKGCSPSAAVLCPRWGAESNFEVTRSEASLDHSTFNTEKLKAAGCRRCVRPAKSGLVSVGPECEW